jgi:hypothetical protein
MNYVFADWDALYIWRRAALVDIFRFLQPAAGQNYGGGGGFTAILPAL